MKKRVTCGFLLLFLALCLSFEPRVQAAYPAAMSAAHPLMGYPLSRARKTIVYTDAARKKKLTTLTYREFSILKYDKTKQSLYVTCKEGTKTIKGWVKRNTFFFTQDFKAVQSFANQNLTLYQAKSTSMYYQSIPLYTGRFHRGREWFLVSDDLLSERPLLSGWIPKTDYGKIRLSMDTTEQLLADGTYTIRARERNRFP